MRLAPPGPHRLSLALGLMTLSLLLAGTASAQLSPPSDDAFHPISCQGQPATDPIRDTPGGSGHRDIVGTPQAPAIFFTSDDTFFYLRMRLD